MEEQRTYIAIDLKSFYASVECIERGLDVLANTVQLKDYDGRFSDKNKEWAKGFDIKENEGHRTNFLVENHPAIVDGFVTMIRNYGKNKEIGEEENLMPENEKKNREWKGVTISRDALLKTNERTSFLRMPNGEYEGYTYNIYNDRITRTTVPSKDENGDYYELAYTLRIYEDENIEVTNRDTGDKKQLSLEEFRAAVDHKGYADYIRKSEDGKNRWTKRKIAISRSNVSRRINKFFSTLGGEFFNLERDFSHRLQDIEKEIEHEREKERKRAQALNYKGASSKSE